MLVDINILVLKVNLTQQLVINHIRSIYERYQSFFMGTVTYNTNLDSVSFGWTRNSG
jgi:hypothetical protein